MKDFGLIRGSPHDLRLASWWPAITVTAIFALFAWLVRAVTGPGALAGTLVLLILLGDAGWGAFLALSSVFTLTWAATRVGYGRKQALGTAEAQKGRSAAQVFANLAVAAGCALADRFRPDPRLLVSVVAALAEAAADTVSSEIGQALGRRPRLITTWRTVAPGTDGAVTLTGTLAGAFSAALVSLISASAHVIGTHQGQIAGLAAVLGMTADSCLGATLERRGLAGNNTVNFLSTAVAASLAFLLA
jgi:uncharacterized protein (TIGR00297 family)